MLRLFILMFLVVTVNASRCKMEPTKFRSDYKYVPEIDGWLKLHRVPTDWFDARARCQLEGADIASPSDEKMLRAIFKLTKLTSCPIYTGIHAMFSKGDYTSVEGIPLRKMPVHFKNSEKCIIELHDNECTVYDGFGFIDTVDCKKLYPFMCYRKNKKIYDICDCGTVDDEYKFYKTTGQCYKVHTQLRTWPDAYKICLAEGGHLAIINSGAEANVIAGIFGQYPSLTKVWNNYHNLLLGFKMLKGTWTTIHGQSLQEAGYALWAPGEPKLWVQSAPHDKKEYCGAFLRDGVNQSIGLDDVWCDVPYAFICEKHPESLLDEDNIVEGTFHNQTVDIQ